MDKPLADTADIQQTMTHFNVLAEGIINPQARFAVLVNTGKGRQTKPVFIPVKAEALLKVISDIGPDIKNKNVYISVNTFYTNSSKQEYLHKLNFLFVDIDCHMGETPTEHDLQSLLFYLEEDFFGSKVPVPTMVVSTGRGLHLYWKIKTMSFNSKNKVFWKNVEQGLLKQFSTFSFQTFEIDTKVSNPNRVLRLAGTYNPQAQQFTKIVFCSEEEYTLTEIWQGYLAETLSTERVEYSETEENSLLYNRLLDLEKLIALRNGNVSGHRQFIVWVARNIMQQLGYSENKLTNKLNAINNSFSKALPQPEIDQEIKRSDIYAFTNEYLISQLKITVKEQKSLKSIVGVNEKRKRITEIRSKEAQRKREQKTLNKENELQLVKSYIEEGYSQAQIAGMLGVGVRKIKDCYKQLGVDKTVKSNKQDILALKEQGYTQKQVADKLSISMSTVRAHWNKKYK